MDSKLRHRIKQATEATDIEQSDFVELLQLIDRHYDQMEATISQTVNQTMNGRLRSTQTISSQSMSMNSPIETVFDSVTQALMSVNEAGDIIVCNKVCARSFGLAKDQLIGSKIEHILPGCKDVPIAEFLEPFVSSLDNTQFDVADGEVEARRITGELFTAEINASRIDAVGTYQVRLGCVIRPVSIEAILAQSPA